MCPQCRPEYLEACYLCGHRFHEFESFYVVKRLMDRGGVEDPWYGVRYGRCQDCPRHSLLVRATRINWWREMGEGRERGEQSYLHEAIVWY